MRRDVAVPALWALGLVAMNLLLWPFSDDLTQHLLFAGGSAVALVVVAVAVAWPSGGPVAPVPATSFATILVAAGLGLLAWSLAFGLWLTWIGLAFTLAGVAGWIRESRDAGRVR